MNALSTGSLWYTTSNSNSISSLRTQESHGNIARRHDAAVSLRDYRLLQFAFLVFRQSHKSIGIQFADVLAGFVMRYVQDGLERGKSITAFCEEHGLCVWQFYEWKKQLKEAHLIVYTFARVSAIVLLRREDYWFMGKRAQLRLQEKGGKEKLVWLHHEAEEFFDRYLEAA